MSEESLDATRQAAHDRVREALRAAAIADLRLWRAKREAESDFEDLEFADSQIAFMESSILADYVAGVLFLDLGGEKRLPRGPDNRRHRSAAQGRRASAPHARLDRRCLSVPLSRR
ncbi:MAG: hypothetical protein JWP14_3399 [Frankiales bacterium]|nr:hypothetical protein [Frankiales bacterium]